MSFEPSFERKELYECGAALLMILACARDFGSEKSLQIYMSLCGKALWLKYLMAPGDLTPILVKSQYVFRDRKTIDRDVRTVEKRLGERMVAGRMAIPFLQQAALGAAGPLPNGIQRLSINQMAEFVLEDAGQADATNVERRYWSPSRPVIHLAAAAAMVGQQRRKSGQSVAFESFLFDRVLIEEIVRGAEEFESLISTDPKFPVKAEQLIRFRLG